MLGTDLDTAAFCCATLLGFDERYGTWDATVRKALEQLLDDSAAEQIERKRISESDAPLGPSREE
jgi:hypothetical protein